MKKIKIITFIILLIIILSICTISKATVTMNVSVSKETVEQNEGFSITISASGGEGYANISATNATISSSKEWIDDKGTTINCTAGDSGDIEIVVDAIISDSDTEEDIPKKETKTIRINTPTPDPEPTPDPDPEPKPEEKDPTFTDANKTMYTTGAINLRESWSTSSKAVQVDKDTEVTVTGTSTDKVNGYVWYRINYNGQTKYVASNLLTETAPEPEEEKSNNTNLKSLIVEGFSLTPSFAKDKTSYTLDVAKDVTKLNIKAESEDEKSTVTVQGNENLKDGENVIAVTVNAEDGSTKIYEIKANRKEIALGLKNLKIEGTDIEKNFKADKYEYKIEIKELSKLNIVAVASDADAKVEITGNEDLKVGENIINIKVTSKDGTQTANYKITVNKLGIETENETVKLDKELIIYIIIGAALLIALIIVIIYTVKHRHQEDDEYEYDEDENYEAYRNIKKVDNYKEIDNYEEDIKNEVENNENIENEYKEQDLINEENKNESVEVENNEISRTDEDFYERLKKIQNKYAKNEFEDENDEIENKTKELKEQLEDTEVGISNENNEQEYDIMKQDRETRLNYFLENTDDFEEERKPRHKKGKHF